MRTAKILPFCLILTIILCPAFAVNTAKIDAVRARETLTDADTTVMEQFLADALSELYEKTDFSDVATLRNTIVSKSTASTESGQIQYGPRFFTAAQKEIASTFKKVNELPNSQRKTLLTINLLILTNDLGNLEISKTALDYLQNSNIIIRYWAVGCLTNANVLRQLNFESEDNKRLAQDVIKRLSAVVQTEPSGDIMAMIADFAAGLKQPAANDLLTAIAEKRIDLYMMWKVNDEMADITILRALVDRTTIDPDSSKVMSKNFAILYSLIIQRYVQGDQLSDTTRGSLVSVITQSEKLIIHYIPDWAGSLKRALEKGGGAGLIAEHDSLFGAAGSVGKLPTVAGFDYGKNPDGSAKTAPPTLSKPPTEKPKAEKPAEKKIEKQPEKK
jgi:hypothetical protein